MCSSINHLSRLFLMTAGSTSTPLKSGNADFPSQSAVSARERNLHHLQRPSDNGPHISFHSPSSTGLTHCDLDLALWYGVNSNRHAKRHECYMILFYPGKHVMPPMPRPKCGDNRDHGLLPVGAFKDVCYSVPVPFHAQCSGLLSIKEINNEAPPLHFTNLLIQHANHKWMDVPEALL